MNGSPKATHFFIEIFMFGYLNQYSYILVSFFVLTGAFFFVYRAFSLKAALLSILILLFAVVLFRSFLTTSSDELSTIEDWNLIQNSGNPVVLYLYSDL